MISSIKVTMSTCIRSTVNLKVHIHIQATSKMSAILYVKPFNRGFIIPLILPVSVFRSLPALLNKARLRMTKATQTKTFKCALFDYSFD